MKTIRILAVIFFFLLLMPFHSGAQELNNTKKNNAFKDNWAIQFQPGFSEFYGDASNHNYFQKLKGEIGLYGDLSIRKMLIPALGVGLHAAYAGLKSYKDRKADGTRVDYHLTGNYYDAGLFLYVNFNHLFAGYKPDRRFTVYGTVGVGWAYWNSALTDGITGLTLRSGSKSGSHTFKSSAMVVPISLGLNYRISDRWSVNIGGDLHTVLNDDVDVWHDGFKYDQIFATNVGITYHIRQGWGTRKVPKMSRKSKKTPCCNQKAENSKAFIPVYDFDQIRMMTIPAKTVKQPHVFEEHPLPVAQKTKPVSPSFEFRVQILASTKPIPNPSSLKARYHLPYAVVVSHQNGYYRYSVGSFKTYSEALAVCKKIIHDGIFDAFVVAYRNGLRVPITPGMKK